MSGGRGVAEEDADGLRDADVPEEHPAVPGAGEERVLAAGDRGHGPTPPPAQTATIVRKLNPKHVMNSQF